MKIKRVIIKERIEEKIFYKHNITVFEIEQALFNNPYVLKAKLNRYMAINWFQKYITIIFEFKDDIAEVITAYPSSETQRKLYKHKRQ